MKINLTPGQGVLVHGWIRAREYMTWGDILNSEKLTFQYLTQTVGLSETVLHTLQPDLQAWIKHNRVVLSDCPCLGLWDAHPINDFKCDLADLIRMRWQPDAYKKMGVHYDTLLTLGLTPETMTLFGFTLMSWIHLGFNRTHCSPIPEPILYRLFGLPKQQLLSCLK